ncbi:hypothetical protein LXG23DRAFT_52693 [Yarrowia lipolytica]|uniref:Uncharacterized protein n=1 Tax=Yarrowia lipolytica TaxID=4952 RepID=A0A1D8N4E6_YARLL|nr:hypothetical protein YALI1_A11079g [Yarrowia lipolytica]KAB8282974.1 hypothetical protein BKA91DRAFT_137669 [Yarrowia lipolytica]KAE8169937.1 hypothetical protein BKA90DRAFT_141760 [Yarrowia lipolytica]KAJ8051570.1 hypothetical protein LXG23DRAFT_52693 [Yarrowia lipolytica]RMI94655.1 hypothetical protein BD777DRAFT_131415 [Yarrowia lipolytica]
MSSTTISTVPETSTADIYFMSSRARNKLARESYKPELNLRKLVAHANLMDSLYDELEYRRSRYQVQFVEPAKPMRKAPSAPTPMEDIPEYESSDEETESEEESEEEDEQDNYSMTVDNNVHIFGEPDTDVMADATFATHHKVQSSDNLTFNEMLLQQ